jgi:HSP20 family protein
MSAFVNELLRLQGNLDSLLRSPRSDFFFGPATAGVFPPINVFRDQQGDMVIRAELPGVKPEDFNLTVEGGRLTISGERHPEPFEGSYHRRERPFGKFSRSIQLPDDLDLDHAAAKLSQGVVTLRLPRAAAARARQIAIQAA